MQFDKTWVPRPLKQKGIIFGYIPVIKRPVTLREIIYFVLALPIGIFIFLKLKNILPVIPLSIFCVSFILYVPFVSLVKIGGRYPEEIILSRLKYRTRAGVVLNSKAVKANKDRQREE